MSERTTRLQTPHFAVELPGDWVEVQADAGYGYERRGGGAELYVAPGHLRDDAGSDGIELLVAERRQTTTEGLPGLELGPVRTEVVGGSSCRWFTGAHRQEQVGCFVAVCPAPPYVFVLSLFDGGVLGSKETERVGLAAMRSLDPSAALAFTQRLDRAQAEGIRTEAIYPQLVSAAYTIPRAAHHTPIGHDVLAVLIEDLGGASRYLTDELLAESQLTAEQAWRLAMGNLQRLAASGELAFGQTDLPGGTPILVCLDHFLSAATLLLPGLHGFVAANLGIDRIRARVPHREGLILYPDNELTEAEVSEHVLPLLQGRKPIGGGVFLLTPDGVEPGPGAET